MSDFDITAEAPAPTQDEVVDNPATAHVRILLVQDQMNAAAGRVNLLHHMGFTRTDGYRQAMEAYETKLGEFNALKARYGL